MKIKNAEENKTYGQILHNKRCGIKMTEEKLAEHLRQVI